MLFQRGQQETQGYKDKKNGKHRKNEVDANAAHLGDDEVTITSAGISRGDADSLSTSSTPRRQKAVNDDTTIDMVTDGLFAQLCLDLNAKVDEPAALIANFKAARAVEMAPEANGTYTYDALTSTTTHHLHDLSFHALQEINTTVYDDIVGLYVQHHDEVYSGGVQNISHELSFDKALRLLVMRSSKRCKTLVSTVCCACCLTLEPTKPL
jgi:hypothetical protein